MSEYRRLILAGMVLAGLLGGSVVSCGQKGPLRHPDDRESAAYISGVQQSPDGHEHGRRHDGLS